jgi:peptide chain release factor 2
MSDSFSRLDALRLKINEAWALLHLDVIEARVQTLEQASAQANFWEDPEKARRELQELAEAKKELGSWRDLRISAMELDEMLRLVMEEKDESLSQEVEARLSILEAQYQKMEFALLFSGKHDASNAIMAIHAGAGGTDAQDWAEMLLRLFFRYAEQKGWNVRLLDESRGGEAGIKSATFLVQGRFAYGTLRGEAGVHRLVRQSPFNSDALRQTSFALVEVLPELEDEADVEIKPDDLRIDTFMSGGKGGQSVNTTYSAVRIVHLPTKITVSCQNERSQTQNREMAMKILKAKLQQKQEEERQKEKQALRGAYQSAEWGNQIRSYVLHPYKMVKDHRTGVETAQAERVLDGDLDQFVEGFLRWDAQERRQGS